ncbi:hypothetical protein CCACVL1_14938 [Corchorus capsularis]|uniref:Uncharacterized protein n=1 Tax=Corchorus capsularis TaxID=210143 RepID=A0A1R3I4U2_COCAP|nr:hypothetical protein CCACVL1_14938 [Corchorus capsularis]
MASPVFRNVIGRAFSLGLWKDLGL